MARSNNQNCVEGSYPELQNAQGIQYIQGLTASPALPALPSLPVLPALPTPPLTPYGGRGAGAGYYEAKKQTSGYLLPTSGVDDKLLNAALNENITVDDRSDKRSVTTQQLNDIVNDIASYYQVKKNHAYIGLTATLQAGGTNKNKRSNVKITLETITFESKKINEFIIKHCKSLTPRQFARCIANDIFYVAVRHNITGNAYISLRRFYPNLLLGTNQHERFWAADFQVDNPNCPDYIRDALRQRYADKFTKKS